MKAVRKEIPRNQKIWRKVFENEMRFKSGVKGRLPRIARKRHILCGKSEGIGLVIVMR